MDLLNIVNDGALLVSTNFWDRLPSAAGLNFLSFNAGVFRLLVPDSQIAAINEWRSAREVIVSRGLWPDTGRPEGIEIMFEDDSDNPYALHISQGQVDRMPEPADRDRPGQPARWIFTVWTREGAVLELPCRYRTVRKIPCLKKFGDI